MPKIFITGGISSGKSDFAEKTAISIYSSYFSGTETPPLEKRIDSSLYFIATAKFSGKNFCEPDEDMMQKIKKHKEKRSGVFEVRENFENLSGEIDKICGAPLNMKTVILIDSMTLWLSSAFKDISDYDFTFDAILKICADLKKIKCSVVTVADSLGFNMVPADAYLRKFIELNGLMEQKLSALSDEAYCVIAGNPLPLKQIKGEI